MEPQVPRKEEQSKEKKKITYNERIYRYLKHAPVEQSFTVLKMKRVSRFVNQCDLWKGRSLGFNVVTFFAKNLTNQPSAKKCAELLPVHMNPDLSQPRPGQLKTTWLGHATVLIQDGPVNIITDPVFVDKIVTYERLIAKPVELKKLPPIDIILISHDHNDHFDQEAVNYLLQQHKAAIVIGKQSEKLIEKASQKYVLDWTDIAKITSKGREYEVHFLPSCHWSGRGVADHFQRLWGGFLIVTPEDKKIFYPGDTGFEEKLFDEINQAVGEIDLCLLPIGAYEPRNFLCYQHINPEEAIKIHKILKSKQTLGIHWGTFQLACEGYLQPREDLEINLHKADEYNNPIGNFCSIEPGQSLIMGIDVATPTFLQGLNGVRITWLGHCSVLIEFNQQAILINPHTRETTKVFQPKEQEQAQVRQVHSVSMRSRRTKVAAVLLTSSSSQFVKECKESLTGPDRQSTFISPRKENMGFCQTDDYTVAGVSISQFTIHEECSYLLKFSNNVVICVYGGFANKAFVGNIRAKSENIDVALLPIRPFSVYDGRKFTEQYMQEVVETHRQLGAQRSIGINWAGFSFSKSRNRTNLKPKNKQLALSNDLTEKEQQTVTTTRPVRHLSAPREIRKETLSKQDIETRFEQYIQECTSKKTIIDSDEFITRKLSSVKFSIDDQEKLKRRLAYATKMVAWNQDGEDILRPKQDFETVVSKNKLSHAMQLIALGKTLNVGKKEVRVVETK